LTFASQTQALVDDVSVADENEKLVNTIKDDVVTVAMIAFNG